MLQSFHRIPQFSMISIIDILVVAFLIYEFETVMVESIQWSGSSGGDDTPTESVSLAFAKVTITYNTVDDKGNPTKAGQAAWDLATVSAK